MLLISFSINSKELIVNLFFNTGLQSPLYIKKQHILIQYAASFILYHLVHVVRHKLHLINV